MDKICRVCGRVLPATTEYFHKHNTCKFGFKNICKECVKVLAHKARNTPEAKQKRHDYYQENKEELERKRKIYYATNRDKILQRERDKNLANPYKRRESRIKAKFDISLEEYNALLEKQHGVCAICGLGESSRDRKGKVRPLMVDHDHKTGKVRGLLCSKCNIGLGQFKDNPTVIKIALEYILAGGF